MSEDNNKNVCSIEEDIKQLKNLIRDRQSFLTGEEEGDEIYLKDIKAINNLINGYTRQKQINEEHQKINGELRKKVKKLEEENKLILNSKIGVDLSYDNYIPKQKIKDRIEKLKRQRRELGFKTYFRKEDMINADRVIMYEISVLEKLVKENK